MSIDRKQVLTGVPFLEKQGKIYSHYVASRGTSSEAAGTRFEIYGSSLRISKFQILFQTVRDGHQVNALSVYIGAEDLIHLFKRMAFNNMAPCKDHHGRQTADVLWIADPMGTPGRDGNPAEYRTFSVRKGTKHDYYVQAGRCDGEVDDRGLITPAAGHGHSRSYGMPLDRKDCVKIYYKLIQAYIGFGTAQWVQGALLGDDLHSELVPVVATSQNESAEVPVDPETGEVTEYKDDIPEDAFMPTDDIGADDLPF